MRALCWPAQLEKAARLLAIDEVVAVLRHDVRNHLASIRNASFFLRRKIEPGGTADAKIAQFFDLIDVEAANAEKVLSSRVPRLDDREPAPIDLGLLAGELVASLVPPEGAVIRAAVGPPAP